MNLKIKSLHIYPVKSAHSVDITATRVRLRGLQGDRRFMIVDASGQFVTQRQNRNLTLLRAEIIGNDLVLKWENPSTISMPFSKLSRRKNVSVWANQVDAAHAGDEINKVLSHWLGQPVSLVFMDDVSQRLTEEDWTSASTPVSFADGYPILVTTTASLAALNAVLRESGELAVPMERFRPNIVVENDEPWAEDNWGQLKIGNVILDLVKPCTRCVMTTIDQKTGARKSREPIRTLKKVRQSNDPRNPGVFFGVYAVPQKLGEIRVGDKVTIG